MLPTLLSMLGHLSTHHLNIVANRYQPPACINSGTVWWVFVSMWLTWTSLLVSSRQFPCQWDSPPPSPGPPVASGAIWSWGIYIGDSDPLQCNPQTHLIGLFCSYFLIQIIDNGIRHGGRARGSRQWKDQWSNDILIIIFLSKPCYYNTARNYMYVLGMSPCRSLCGPFGHTYNTVRRVWHYVQTKEASLHRCTNF